MVDLAIGVIKKVGNKWCLYFSNNRKECFPSRKQAEKREKQVNYFKHRNSSEINAEDLYIRQNLGILAEIMSEDQNEIIYFVEKNNSIIPILAKNQEDGEKEIIILDEEYEKYSDYAESVDKFLNSFAANGIKSLKLTEAVIGNQLLSGSHSHTVELEQKENGWYYGETSEEENHKHYILLDDLGYLVSTVNIEMKGIIYPHTHLIVIS